MTVEIRVLVEFRNGYNIWKEYAPFHPPLLVHSIEALELIKPIIEKQFGPTALTWIEEDSMGVSAK